VVRGRPKCSLRWTFCPRAPCWWPLVALFSGIVFFYLKKKLVGRFDCLVFKVTYYQPKLPFSTGNYVVSGGSSPPRRALMNTCEAFDPETQRWTQHSALKCARHSHAMVTLGGEWRNCGFVIVGRPSVDVCCGRRFCAGFGKKMFFSFIFAKRCVWQTYQLRIWRQLNQLQIWRQIEQLRIWRHLQLF